MCAGKASANGSLYFDIFITFAAMYKKTFAAMFKTFCDVFTTFLMCFIFYMPCELLLLVRWNRIRHIQKSIHIYMK